MISNLGQLVDNYSGTYAVGSDIVKYPTNTSNQRGRLREAMCAMAISTMVVAITACSSIEHGEDAIPAGFHVNAVSVAPAVGTLGIRELIDRLQDESNQGVGTHATAWVSGFIPLDVPAIFGGGILGSRAPSVSPVMVALVSRGVDALPDLLEHLSDARPTRLVVGQGFMGKWFGSEYDPKVRARPPADVDRPFGSSFSSDGFSAYTLRVGDLCYVAIGQIVGRNLLAIRYQPTLCLVVNSPVERPALARAVRTDWAGLTKDEHCRSLEAEGAIAPLLFYYPARGATAVRGRLDRELYDDAGIYGMFTDALFLAPEGDQAEIVAKFLREHGVKYRAGLQLALQDLATRENPYGDEQVKAKSVLRNLFEGQAPVQAGGGIVSYRDQQYFVRSLNAFEWSGLDDELWAVFKRASAEIPCGLYGRLCITDLELECAQRLSHAGHDAEIASRFRDEIAAFEHDDAAAVAGKAGYAGFHPAIRQRLNQLQSWLAKVHGADIKAADAHFVELAKL